VRAIDATGDRQPAFWPPRDEAFETVQGDLQHSFPAIATGSVVPRPKRQWAAPLTPPSASATFHP
jgi:hypothetical protein